MFILNFSRTKKSALMILADIVLVTFSLWLAFALRMSEGFWPSQTQLWLFILAPIIALPIFIKFGLYRAVIRYIGYRAMLAIFQATGMFVLVWLLVVIALVPRYLGADIWFPRSIPLLFWMTLLLTVGGSRQAVRWVLSESNIGAPKAKRSVLIYGAGKAGFELATSLSYNQDVRTLGFIDDDKTLHGHYIQNLKILGGRSKIVEIRARTGPLEVLLAMPRLTSEFRKELLTYLEDKYVSVRTIPPISDIASRAMTIDDLRDVDITDLLARKVVAPNQHLLSKCVTGKRILVTGAGGSIGSELCRQILPLKPSCLVLFEHSEHSIYQINRELSNYCKKENHSIEIIPVLGSITNKQRVEDIIKQYDINTIYHAAAYKHVALIESNIEEGVLNNIFGTYNVAQAALDLSVENFILISTDKAVRATSVMGATKRFAEIIVQGLSQKKEASHTNEQSPTHFTIVRFGNVLGSSGSVIPLFQKQIAHGGPITITHPDVTRYFMTISEASQLVLQAGAIGDGRSNVFVLDMGEPVSILSLAKQLVYLSGHMLKTDESNSDSSAIEIQYTGLQQGEKIHEELFIGDNITNTEHPMILEAKEGFFEWQEIEEMLAKLKSWHNLNKEEKRKLLLQYSMEKGVGRPNDQG
jgi:UDP-N-acetylglucosamine 4,6-dehydratase